MESSPPSTEFDSIFREMSEANTVDGRLTRRVPTAGGCDIWIGVRKPSNVRFFQAAFASGSFSVSDPLPTFQSLSLNFESGDLTSGSDAVVTLQAPVERDNAIFTRLIEDVAGVAGAETESRSAAMAFRSRLIQWQRLMQRERNEGLSDEEQCGLYGELCVLEQQVLTALPALESVRAWTGPLRTAKDFHFAGAIAIEVKTSLALPPFDIHISSERQLDTAGLQALYLIHRLFDVQRGAGETLPERVAGLRNLLAPDIEALGLFEDRLEEAGYFDLHASRYRENGFTGRGVRIYAVLDGFPRIVPASLPHGIGSVEYLLAAEACAGYIVQPEAFANILEDLT